MAKRKKPSKKPIGLNPRQEAFKNNLLKGMGKQEAYEAVEGYTATGGAAAANATRLLKNAKFADEYEKAKQKAADRAEASIERVLREECRIAFADIAEIFKGETLIAPEQLPPDIRRAISSVKIHENKYTTKDGREQTKTTYEYKLWDKGRSLERIMKHLGGFEKDNEQLKPQIIQVVDFSDLNQEKPSSDANNNTE